ncbi:unnamed protein product [Ilex paraguariensis]|uniref:Uncharacterized protein n=1 Tax=Ilex paraguariensis TaxID=185542 RepID=A0ABC8RLP4_9AQUA
MGLQRKQGVPVNGGEQFDIRLTVEEFKHSVGMYTLWKPGMETHVSHVKRRSIPTFIFPGGVRPLRPTEVAGERRQVSEAKVPSHAETGKLFEGKATPEGPDDGRKRKHEDDIVGTNLGGSKYLAGVGFSSEEGHDGDPFVCISTLDCLKEKVRNNINGVIEKFKDPAGLPSQNNCGRDESIRCSTPIVYLRANGASSSSKEAEKLAIEKIMSGPYVAHQAFPQELEELDDDTEYNGQVKILGGSATKSSMDSSTTKSVVLSLTTCNGAGPLSAC